MSTITDQLQSQYDQANQGFTQGYGDILKRQSAEQTAYLANEGNLTDRYKKLTAEAGIPDLTSQLQGYKDQIRNIQNTLNGLDQNVSQRTAGSFTTEAQRQRQVTAESNPLQTNLAGLGIASAPIQERLTSAQTGVNNMMNLIQADRAQALSLMSEKFAREITGYTTTKQVELNGLLDKLTRQRTLDDNEMERAFELSKMEKDYALQRKNATTGLTNNPFLTNNQSNTTTPTSTATGQATRAGNTDNISYGGKTYTREAFASALSGSMDRNSDAWKTAYAQILKEFPDINKSKSGNTGYYVSPTALFGMKG